MLHPSLRVIDATTGEVVGELRDEGRQLGACGFSPIPGDARLAITHERTGEERPAVWDPRTGEVVDLELELVGPVEAVDWWPDGGSLLLLQLVEGRHRLHRYHLDTGRHRAARHRARIDHGGRRPPRRRGLVPRPSRRAPGADPRDRHGDAAARGRRPCRAARPRLRVVVVHEPGRRAGPWLPRPARGRRAAPGHPPRPRRAALRRPRPLGAGPPGARRRRLPRRDGQLPRLGGLRAGVARCAQGQRRLPRARGRAGGPRRPRRSRARRPGARRARRAGRGAAT